MESEIYKKAYNSEKTQTLLGILKVSDEEAYHHCIAVSKIVDEYLQIAKEQNELKWTEQECLDILIGAMLLDIGKAFLPFSLQYSTGSLTAFQREIINMHPILGRVTTEQCGLSEITNNIILMHHAKINGQGYPVIDNKPFTLENVPDYVWLIAYADCFEAMTNVRSFKIAKSYPEAWKELLEMVKKKELPHQYTRIFGLYVKRNSILKIKDRNENI